MTRITTVLFDLDGTLIDSVRLILDSYHHTLATHQLPPKSDAFWLEGLGRPLRVQFRHWSDNQEQLEALIATYREFNMAHHDEMVTVYRGVPEMIGAIRRAGLRTGLVTSKNRPGALRGLAHTGLADTMDVLIGADDVEHPKPHPEPVLLALSQLGSSPGESMYVGDSIHDMESGRAAGVETGAVLWGPFGRAELESAAPNHWLARPDDLLRVLAI